MFLCLYIFIQLLSFSFEYHQLMNHQHTKNIYEIINKENRIIFLQNKTDN